MWHNLIGFSILAIVASEEPTPPTSGAKPTDVAAEAKSDVASARLVRRAIRFEADHRLDERNTALRQALRIDPKNETAHGLLGEVSYRGRWEAAEEIGKQMTEDSALAATLAEYNTRRDQIEAGFEYEYNWEIPWYEQKGDASGIARVKARMDRERAERHVKLGVWCEMKGLKEEAVAHFTTAVLLNPHDATTWRHLGYTRYGGRWLTYAQVVTERREEMAQKHADRQWEPQLKRWAAQLAIPNRRAHAEASLAKVSDPQAVPMIARVLGGGPPDVQLVAVRMLERINTPTSTGRLAALAVSTDAADVARAAARVLRGRELRDYAGQLVDAIRPPMSYEMQPVDGPGSTGMLVVDSPRFRITRTYDAPPAFRLSTTFYGYVGRDFNGLPVVISGSDLRSIQNDLLDGQTDREIDAESRIRAAEVHTAEMLVTANLRAQQARRHMAADVRALDEAIASARKYNPRIKETLQLAMDAPSSLADDDDVAWHRWYYEKIGYRYDPPPKEYAAINMLPRMSVPEILSCFAAGTPVRTLAGPRPIESIRCGDRVLAQDVETGALSFRAVLAVHHNPPDQTLRVALDHGDAVVCSRFHRFWRAGRGWAMARELKSGDVLRTLGGLSRVVKVEDAPVQPVFNLDVADARTFFVGESSMLVHDNTLPPPHPTVPPFDALAAPSSPGT